MHRKPENIDWSKLALESEIEYSKARGGCSKQYTDFIHIYNSAVPFAGDFNRTVAVNADNIQTFNKIVAKIEALHKERNLDRPNRYDIKPPNLDEVEWNKLLKDTPFRLATNIFFQSESSHLKLLSNFEAYIPSKEEYAEWYENHEKATDYYDKVIFEKLQPLQLKFIETFKPYWLKKAGTMVGWVYGANFGEYLRLFEVEIKNEYRGQGFGRILLNMIRSEAAKSGCRSVLLQTGERLRPFYEKSGFMECARISVIWLKQ